MGLVAATPGDRGGLHPRVQGVLQPGQPSRQPVYYQSTIAGLTAYCNAETAYFANKANKPTAANIAGFQNSHTISGLSAPNS